MRGISSATNGLGVVKIQHNYGADDKGGSVEANEIQVLPSHPQLWQALCMTGKDVGIRLKQKIREDSSHLQL